MCINIEFNVHFYCLLHFVVKNNTFYINTQLSCDVPWQLTTTNCYRKTLKCMLYFTAYCTFKKNHIVKAESQHISTII